MVEQYQGPFSGSKHVFLQHIDTEFDRCSNRANNPLFTIKRIVPKFRLQNRIPSFHTGSIVSPGSLPQSVLLNRHMWDSHFAPIRSFLSVDEGHIYP